MFTPLWRCRYMKSTRCRNVLIIIIIICIAVVSAVVMIQDPETIEEAEQWFDKTEKG